MISFTPLKNRSLLLLYTIIILFISSTIFFYFQTRSNAVAETLRRKGSLSTVFILHEDNKPILTIMYLYNHQTRRAAMFDIPSNLAVISNDRNKFVPISTYFNPRNPQDYVQKIKKLLALSDSSFYISMDFNGFSLLADLINGIEVFVANDTTMQYNGEILMLSSGAVILDGAKVREYLLANYQNASQNRKEELNRRFVGSFIKRISQKSSLLANPFTVEKLHDHLMSDMNEDAMLEFWKSMELLDKDNFISQKITGTLRFVDNQQLLFPFYEGKLIKEMMNQTQLSLSNPKENLINTWPRRIEIQNGTTINGLAQRTAQIYESLGYNVVSTSNATSNDVDYTVVIDFSNNIEVAQRIGEVIRTNRIYSFDLQLEEEFNMAENIDVRIILGRDFDGRYAQQVNN